MDRRGFLAAIGSVALSGASARTAFADESGNDFSTTGLPGRQKVTAMGVGGAGGSILNQVIGSNVLTIDQSIYINTNSCRNDVSAADQKIILGNGEWQPAISAARLALARIFHTADDFGTSTANCVGDDGSMACTA